MRPGAWPLSGGGPDRIDSEIAVVLSAEGRLGGYPLIGLMLVLMAMLAGASVGARTLYLAARQTRLAGRELSWAVGVGRSLSAGGSLAGVWIGLALDVARDPIWGLVATALTTAALTLFLTRRT
ncbi:MAG: hypothetical protein ACRDXX_22355 [Stackebrandtia sp.]